MNRLEAAFRRTGADLPGGDPRPTHGAEMEGWFWRFTDTARDRVVVALCGVNRHPAGDWATIAVAAEPGGIVRSVAADGAHASAERLEIGVPGVFSATERWVRVDLDDLHLWAEVGDPVAWPLRLGAGGVFSAVPFLGQYWHPHVLGGRARGELNVADETWALDGADVYAEKNWGAGFPDRWWWGQAQGFSDPTLCVAFGGGHLDAGPVGLDVTGCVVRIGSQVLRFAPPFALVRTEVDGGRWRVDARRPGWRAEIDGHGQGHTPTLLPVPLPAERRNVDRDLEHLAGRMHVRIWRRGHLLIEDDSTLAGLEVGSTDQDQVDRLAHEHGLTAGASQALDASRA